MRSRSGIGDVLFGSGLIVALTLILSIAAALAGIGLVFELGGARIVVVTQHPTVLVASQTAADVDVSASGDLNGGSGHVPGAGDGGVQVDRPTIGAEAGPGDPKNPRPGESEADGGTDGGEVAERATDPAAAGPTEALADERPPADARPVARVRPTPGPRGAPRSSADLPIVMYHHVGPLPPNPDVYRRDLTVAPDVFEQTLDELAEQGIETVTMADLIEHFAGGPALPERAVILTFDDGYDDNFEHAFRLLQERGMVGTFFVTTDFVEQPGYLTWDQVAEMADAGMEIAAHSTNHADLTLVDPNELQRQLVEPKQILEHHIGQRVRFLAYPAGKYDADVMAASRAAGYEAAVTVLHGTHHTSRAAFELPRVRARGADTVSDIIARMMPPTWDQ